MQKYNLNRVLNAHSNKVTLSHIFLLENPENIEILGKHPLVNQLEKYGFIFNGEVTPKGNQLLEIIDNEVEFSKKGNPKPNKVKVELDKDFLEWWEEFPRTDYFSINGREFIGDRNLRTNKNKCNEEYIKLKEEFGHERLLKALKKEIQVRKDLSFQRNKNQLSYIRASERYLTSRAFLNYLDKAEESSENNVTFVRNQL